jgi:hypothetical protein
LGISRLKRLIIEDLTRAFTASEITKFIHPLIQNIDLYKLTGYPSNAPIPRKEAAKQIIDLVHKKNMIQNLLNLYIQTAQRGFKGEKIIFNNTKPVVKEMHECGFAWSKDLKKVVLIGEKEKRTDWGLLEEGKTYNFCFGSVDISQNSRLVRTYHNSLIRSTYQNFKTMVTRAVESRFGRIWTWEGDGGLVAFHLQDFVNLAVLSSVDILSSMPYFNTIYNYLGENIRIRIALHAGNANYNGDTATTHSEAIERVRQLEKHYTELSTITVSKSTFPHISSNIRNNFKEISIDNEQVYQLQLPIRRGK